MIRRLALASFITAAISVGPVTAENFIDDIASDVAIADASFGGSGPDRIIGSIDNTDLDDLFQIDLAPTRILESIDIEIEHPTTGHDNHVVLFHRSLGGLDGGIYASPGTGTSQYTIVNSKPDERSFEVYLDYHQDPYTYELIFTYKVSEFFSGQLLGSTLQTQIQTAGLQFQTLSGQLRTIGGSLSTGGFDAGALVTAPTPSQNDGVQLVSYQQPGTDSSRSMARPPAGQRSYRGVRIGNGWGGWSQSYGIGGFIGEQSDISGVDYGAGGTQLGAYRAIDDYTALGVFGGYGYQNVDSGDAGNADIHSGSIGTFLYRGDGSGDYYILAGSCSYDAYETERGQDAQADFDGVQTGAYLERGLMRQWGHVTVQPRAALQHVWIHQQDHRETGTAAFDIDEVDAHSLRSLVGATFYGGSLLGNRQVWDWRPTSQATWMHEFLDTATTVTGTTGGTSLAATGLDLGRDWAVLGIGVLGNRRSNLTLFANYDMQVNEHVQFHTGSGGLIWRR